MGLPRTWIAPLAFTLVLRLVFLVAALEMPPIADERTYLNLAHWWNETGVYVGRWPPGQPFLIALVERIVGVENTPAAMRLIYTLLALPLCALVMALGSELFGERAGSRAGWIFALYLPLAGFHHMLWPEIPCLLFLVAALWLMARYGRLGRAGSPWWILPSIGACLGISLLFKEVHTYLVPLACIWIVRRSKLPMAQALVPGLVVLGSIALTLAPWSLRNADVYQRFVPLGSTLGINVNKGLATRYVNVDYNGIPMEEVHPKGGFVEKVLLAEPPPRWERSKALNYADAGKQDMRSALVFAGENPGYFLRRSVLKLADFVAPLSFLTRGFRLRQYGQPLATPLARRLVVGWATLAIPLLLLAAVLGLTLCKIERANLVLLGTTLLYVLATGLVVSLSRSRAPLEPLLMVAAAGAWVGKWHITRLRVGLCGLLCLTLVCLWALGAGGVSTALGQTW